MLKPPTRYLLYHIWVNYNDLTATSLEFMVNKGNHPQVALIQELTLLFYIITQLVLLDQLLGGHDANLEGNSIINSWFIQSSARVKSRSSMGPSLNLIWLADKQTQASGCAHVS